jgi:hypothetical protein
MQLTLTCNLNDTLRMYCCVSTATMIRRTRQTVRLRLKHDSTRAETRFRLSPKRTRPFKPAGPSVQSTAGSRGVRISVSNAWYTTFRGSVRVLAIHSIRQFPLHFSSRASPCAIRFQKHSTLYAGCIACLLLSYYRLHLSFPFIFPLFLQLHVNYL